MKFKILAGLALSTVAIAACKVDVIDDAGGFGGSADTVTTATTGATKATTAATNATTAATNVSVNASTTTGGPVACADIPVCSDMDMDDTNDCIGCAVANDCSAEVQACAANMDCVAMDTCVNDCPSDNPATPENEFVDCLCTSADGMTCDAMQPATTCVGQHEEGANLWFPYNNCLFATCADGGGPCAQ